MKVVEVLEYDYDSTASNETVQEYLQALNDKRHPFLLIGLKTFLFPSAMKRFKTPPFKPMETTCHRYVLTVRHNSPRSRRVPR